MNNTLTYAIGNSLYINLTNKCSNNCDFCIRNHSDGIKDYYLWLDKEPTASEIIALLDNVSDYSEVVFCGFGEPTYAFEVMVEVAKFVKSKGIATRINTNGHGNEINNRDITRELGQVVDTINISLNASDSKKYDEVCQSIYNERAFDIMLDFARKCVQNCKSVVLSVVDCIGEEEIKKCEQIAKMVGAKLRVRELI